MNKYTIYRKRKKVADVVPKGKVSRYIMGEEVANFEFTLTLPTIFQIGDYVDVYGERYWLNVPGTVQKISEREYKYNLRFESVKYELAKVQLLFPDEFNHLRIPDFSVVGTAETVIKLIVRNANRAQTALSGYVPELHEINTTNSSIQWGAGIIENTLAKNHTFSTNNLLQALSKLAETYELEFYIDHNRAIHFKKKKVTTDIKFKYGESKGLRSITRSPYDNSNIVTRLYAYGADKNIPTNYGTTRIKMPVYYLEANTEKYGVIEHTILFDDIYPHREGVVTSVFADDPMSFIDAGIDFDLNETDEQGNTLYLINGISAKVTFNTGQLAGYTFDIRDHGFDSETNKITLNPNEDEALNVPNDLMRPELGDKYVITDIRMPQTYVDVAERLVQERAEKYLLENCNPRFQYTCVADPLYFELEGRNVELGYEITIADDDLQVNKAIRVIGWTKSLQNKYAVEFVLSDVVTQSAIVRNYIQQDQLNSLIYTFNNFNAFSQRQNWRINQELLDMIFDSDGYFDPENIRPLSIETKMLSVGSRLQQFALPGVVLSVANENTAVHNTAGELVHLTILDEGTRTWILNEQVFPNLDEDFYYIYARCQREGTGGYIFLSHEQINVDAHEEYYHFEVGALSSINEGFRRIKTTYGFTTINGRELTTGQIIQQSTGELFIDIDNRKIIGDVEFLPNSTAYQQMLNSIGTPRPNLYIGGAEPEQVVELGENLVKIGTHENLTPLYSILTEGELFTLSCFVENGEVTGVTLETPNETSNLIDSLVIVKDGNNAQKRVEVSFIANNGVIGDQLLRLLGSCTGINKLKIEKGTPATTFAMSQEEFNEQEARIASVENRTNFLNTTIIDGNVVATGTLLVGNENGSNAGISGVGNNEDVFFWAGSNYSNRNEAPVRFTRDGNGAMRGHIEALSGSFGIGENTFEIYEYGLRSSNGWLFIGSPETGKFLQVQPGTLTGTEGEAIVQINNTTTGSHINRALMVTATGATYNYALIINGNVLSEGRKGYTGTWMGKEFKNGILVE